MLKQIRHSVLLSYFNYAFIARKTQGTFQDWIKPDILFILNPKLIRKAPLIWQLWSNSTLGLEPIRYKSPALDDNNQTHEKYALALSVEFSFNYEINNRVDGVYWAYHLFVPEQA